MRVSGQSMRDANIHDGDLLVIDKSLEPHHNDTVIAIINGEFTVKILHKSALRIALIPANPNYSAIEVNDAQELHIWGVVTHSIHKHR